jgi:hypothetical protein
MPPKTTPTTVITLESVGDTSITNTDSQVVINDKINSIGMSKVKMPLIKQFSGEKAKFKGFLT